MVASTNNLGELIISEQNNHHCYHHSNYYQQTSIISRPRQTAQDKRSRLSDVINNLRRKVPESSRECSLDERHSVARNLETLEKYVMTVLNGVIKDAETEGHRVEGVNAIVDVDDSSKFNGSSSKVDLRIIAEDGGRVVDTVVNREPSEPSAVEPAVPDEDKIVDNKDFNEEENKKSHLETLEEVNDESVKIKDINVPLNITESASRPSESNSIESSTCRQVQPTEVALTLIDNSRSICKDILNDLLNNISQAIIEPNIETPTDNLTTSLHCSLPLDKIAPVLQSYEPTQATSTSRVSSKTPPKSSSSPTVRHLCLYCDRKFLSISLRQRHIERVHQFGGGRRSQRNPSKSTRSCQYCSEKCADSLDGIFQHMTTCHGDKYHACIPCNTRYSTREALMLHETDVHDLLDKSKDSAVIKIESHHVTRDALTQNIRDLTQQDKSEGDKRFEHKHCRRTETTAVSTSTKLNIFARIPPTNETSNCDGSDFDSSFYSSVSCNIRENLLHHLDGKLQNNANTNASLITHEPKPQLQQHWQTFHDPISQIQLPIDISLTAATPVDSKDYPISNKCDNSSEYAQKPDKPNRAYPRRVSFEKYNFPPKYDGKEQWVGFIQDLSKFDISTQLILKKKQQLIKDKIVGEIIDDDLFFSPTKSEATINVTRLEDVVTTASATITIVKSSDKLSEIQDKKSQSTAFSEEFENFMSLRRSDVPSPNIVINENVICAELTGEWSRPRVYICGACSSRHLTLKEIEEHKTFAHPNVWCSHLEFTGDQRELYKHLFLPGRSVPTTKAKNAVLHEKICTKCSKLCGTLAELHRHMLECGGDQAWLLGLFGNGKKKCKWRPFGSRSRRRRQRGMKRNISNSQSPRNNPPKEKSSNGPRVRPSDRKKFLFKNFFSIKHFCQKNIQCYSYEIADVDLFFAGESIQKMLANLPAKRSTRRVIQNATSQARIRKVRQSNIHSFQNFIPVLPLHYNRAYSYRATRLFS